MGNTRSSVTMTGPAVVGTDGSDHAMRAVRWAAGEECLWSVAADRVCHRDKPLKSAPLPGEHSRKSTASRKACWKRLPHSHAEFGRFGLAPGCASSHVPVVVVPSSDDREPAGAVLAAVRDEREDPVGVPTPLALRSAA